MGLVNAAPFPTAGQPVPVEKPKPAKKSKPELVEEIPTIDELVESLDEVTE